MARQAAAGAAGPTAIASRAEALSPLGRHRRRNWLPYMLAVPILAYEGVFILYPIGQGIASSFTRTDVGRPVTFVGLSNYQRMLTDPSFWVVMLHTLVYMLKHKSRAAATESWAKFSKDPEWVKLKAESEANGAFVEKHDITFMTLTDFSPRLG